MKILFLTDNFPPEVNAPANRSFEHCLQWVKEGMEVTIITCVPNFPKGKVFDGYKNKWKQIEYIQGIKVIRVWSYISANEGFIKRIFDYISFSLTSFIAGLFIKTDIIIATSPQFFTALSGRWLSFFKRRPWVMEVRDLWPESIVAVGAMKKNIIISFFEWLEMRLYKNADRIIVVTDTFKDKISKRGILASKISVHKNGANVEMYKPQGKDPDILKETGLEEKFIFAYIGTHGMAHALDFVLNSVGKLQQSYPHFHFLFIGDGAEKNNLLALRDRLELNNVTMLPSVPKDQVVRYLSVMDVALVNLRKSDTFKLVIPSKIFEAAAMRKPILLGLEGETKELIEAYNAGICFEPENEQDFLEKVVQISQENIYYSCKIGCSELSVDFNRNNIAKQMLEDIVKVVAAP